MCFPWFFSYSSFIGGCSSSPCSPSWSSQEAEDEIKRYQGLIRSRPRRTAKERPGGPGTSLRRRVSSTVRWCLGVDVVSRREGGSPTGLGPEVRPTRPSSPTVCPEEGKSNMCRTPPGSSTRCGEARGLGWITECCDKGGSDLSFRCVSRFRVPSKGLSRLWRFGGSTLRGKGCPHVECAVGGGGCRPGRTGGSLPEEGTDGNCRLERPRVGTRRPEERPRKRSPRTQVGPVPIPVETTTGLAQRWDGGVVMGIDGGARVLPASGPSPTGVGEFVTCGPEKKG